MLYIDKKGRVYTLSIFESNLSEMKNGYAENDDDYTCLICGKLIEKGRIYQEGERFYEAYKFMKLHVEEIHGSVFSYLIEQDKEISGLSEQHKAVMQQMFESKSDREIQETLNIGSASTVRNHRFALKKKEKQAKILLTLMSLIEEGQTIRHKAKENKVRFEKPFHVTDSEYQAVLKKNFTNGKLRTFKLQEKHRFIVLCELVKKFEFGKLYKEKEVNELITESFEDHTFIRRYLVEYQFLGREKDGSAYWRKEE